MTFPIWLGQQHPKIPLAGAQAILGLAEGGATVPFIARYLRVIFGDTDQMGMVYYANYLRHFEVAHNEYLRAAGANYRASSRRTVSSCRSSRPT